MKSVATSMNIPNGIRIFGDIPENLYESHLAKKNEATPMPNDNDNNRIIVRCHNAKEYGKEISDAIVQIRACLLILEEFAVGKKTQGTTMTRIVLIAIIISPCKRCS